MKVFDAGITKAGGIEADKLRPALEDIEIDDPASSPKREEYAQHMWQRRQRKA